MNDPKDPNLVMEWGAVELMGREIIAGRISRDPHFGLIKVEAPLLDGVGTVGVLVGVGSVFRITPCDELIARKVCNGYFTRWSENINVTELVEMRIAEIAKERLAGT
jgi:hypothetical protein